MYEILTMSYCVYYILTETVIILAAFLFQIFPKMPKFAATHREMTTKARYQLISKSAC